MNPFVDELVKIAGEAAVGIPDRSKKTHPRTVKKPEQWEFAIHEHEAERAGCFTADAPVLLGDGTRLPISEVRPGDSVAIPQGIARVVRVWDNGPASHWLKISAGVWEICCTPNHPFFVQGIGWVPIGLLSELEGEVDEAGQIHVQPQDLSCLRGVLRSGEGQEECDLREELRSKIGASAYGTEAEGEYRPEEVVGRGKGRASAPEGAELAVAGRLRVPSTEVSDRRILPTGDSGHSGVLQNVGYDCLGPARDPAASEAGAHLQSSEEDQRGKQLELAGGEGQRQELGMGRAYLRARQGPCSTGGGARRAVRMVRGRGEQNRSSPRHSLPILRRPLSSESRSSVPQAPRRGRRDLLRTSREVLRIERLPRASRSRFDLEVEGAHCYYVGGFLVHNSHYDVRLGDPRTGIAHSWATRYLPEPGKSVRIIPQPDHVLPYMDFSGEIKSGYGKGKVALPVREKAEVYHVDPGKVRFNVYKGQGQEEFAIVRAKDHWRLVNKTLTRGRRPDIPSSKPKYREIAPEAVDVEDASTIMQRKDDGAHVTYLLEKGKVPRVFSYRPTERETGVIEHTHKLPHSILKKKVPKELHGTILRGELFATDKKTGFALPSEVVGGMLNANVWKSREKQERLGRLRGTAFDVVRHRGRDMEDAPYTEKLEILQEIAKSLPIELPEMATTPKEKARLMARIRAGSLPETKEGVVLWPLEGKKPTKAVFRPTSDVYIRRIVPGRRGIEGKAAGGFEFSWSEDGPIVGKVGTGFSSALREDMHRNPDKYIGRVAMVKALDIFRDKTTGEPRALRAPAFKGWHLDKNKDTSDLVSK